MAARLIGYARATLTGPSLDDQEKALRKAGCKIIFRDDLPQRPTRRFAQRAAAIEDLEKGDIFVTGSLDRVASSLPDLVATIWSIICLGCGVRTLAEPLKLDPDGVDGGRAVVGALAAAAKVQNAEVYAESESKRRVRRGRKDALADEDWPKVAEMLEKQSVSDVARQLGVSRPTIYRLRKRME
ncbi:hypothetical protein BSL82_17965 (plasmid) [Tardibacter chloracetimidivorans]|uniref:Resolvase/invertase-type recombinase catalytic domain-containing protein n=3 Tax=Sphingomonadaceae TaxID=41297 RepID=A0A1L4A0C1_9SPHN|nr:recombinase family protein [Sphingobium scionense]API61323.1 hypothetical protein BSL82_17965 [Tardibacter chloracetimidivorans]MBB4151199.1 DNA invertase Pin-like site-specific DNA recombinase [Sphingobium scionense]